MRLPPAAQTKGSCCESGSYNNIFKKCFFSPLSLSLSFCHPFPWRFFPRPDLFKYRLINCKLVNSTFLHNKEGCLLSDVSDDNNAYMVYFVSFLGTLAVLPGNIVSALLMDKIGRLRMLGGWHGCRGRITSRRVKRRGSRRNGEMVACFV